MVEPNRAGLQAEYEYGRASRDRENVAVQIVNNASDVFPELLLMIRRNDFAAVLCAEHNV